MAKGIPELVNAAREQLSSLTGLELSTTLGAFRDEKGWHISVEMIERNSIPDSMDILGTYEAVLDDNGNLLQFNRTNLRKRIDTEVAEAEA